MPSSGLQNLPSGRLRTALGQILESLGQILEALGQDFLQNPSGRGWIFYQNLPNYDQARIKIHQTWQIINPLQERAQQLLDELHVVFKDWVTKRRGERIKHDKGWVHSLI